MLSSEFYKYIDSEEFKDILKSYEESRASGSPCYVEAEDLIDIAEYYHFNNQLEKSEAAAKYCLEHFPDNVSAVLFLARLELVDYDNLQQAKKYYNSVADTATNYKNVEALYIHAEILIREEKKQKANDILADYYTKKYKEYCHLFDSQGHLFDTREHLFEHADSDKDEDNMAIFFNFPLDVAMLFCEHTEFELAEIWINKAKHMDDTFEFQETIARIYSGTHQPEKAITAWNKVLDIDAFYVGAWINLWEAQFTLKQYEDSLTSIDYALAIQSDLPEGLIAKANTLYQLGRFKETIDCLQKLIELVPGDPISEIVLSLAYMHMDDYDNAVTHVERAMKILQDLSMEERMEVIRLSGSYIQEFGQLYNKINPDDDDEPTPLV